MSYCSGLIDTGFSRIPSTAPADGTSSSEAIQDHLRLLEVCEQVVKEVIKSPAIQSVSAPMLLHPDIHKRNIFVSDDDPTRSRTRHRIWLPIVQSTRPFLKMSRTRHLIRRRAHTTANAKRKSPSVSELSRLLWKVGCPSCTMPGLLTRHYSGRYDTAIQPGEMAQLRSVKNSLNCLSIGMNWAPNSCPYQPSPQELTGHAKEWGDFETFQRLKLFLIRSLHFNTDGWVPPEAWEAAKDANQSAFGEWMKTVAQSEDPGMNENRGRKLWPFDVNIVD